MCARAQVAPRAIYARANTKDALFLAVYEHGIARVRTSQAVFTDDHRWQGLAANQLATDAVREVAGIFARHSAFPRSVVLISGVHPEVYRRGGLYAQELNDQFTAVLMRTAGQIDQPDPEAEAAVRAAFDTVFSTLVLRTAHGPAFATPTSEDDGTFLETLTTIVRRYLFRSTT